jgi:hypothetical protein
MDIIRGNELIDDNVNDNEDNDGVDMLRNRLNIEFDDLDNNIDINRPYHDLYNNDLYNSNGNEDNDNTYEALCRAHFV